MKVVDREKGLFDPTYMNFDQLDDTLVILSIGGKEILLDPGEKMCPFQTPELEALRRQRRPAKPG